MQQSAVRARKRPASREHSSEQPSVRPAREAPRAPAAEPQPSSASGPRQQPYRDAASGQQQAPAASGSHPAHRTPSAADADENVENQGHRSPARTGLNGQFEITAGHNDQLAGLSRYSGHPVSVKPPGDTDAAMLSLPAGDLLQQRIPPHRGAGQRGGLQHDTPGPPAGSAALLKLLIESDHVSWKEVMWQACNLAVELHSGPAATADQAFGEAPLLVFSISRQISTIAVF
jgi:hypothetical protein